VLNFDPNIPRFPPRVQAPPASSTPSPLTVIAGVTVTATVAAAGGVHSFLAQARVPPAFSTVGVSVTAAAAAGGVHSLLAQAQVTVTSIFDCGLDCGGGGPGRRSLSPRPGNTSIRCFLTAGVTAVEAEGVHSLLAPPPPVSSAAGVTGGSGRGGGVTRPLPRPHQHTRQRV
jgi:hypothetical protein